MFHSVLVVEDSPSSIDYYYVDMSCFINGAYCIEMKLNGVIVIFSRFEDGNIAKAIRSKQWIDSQREKITAVIA